jgi:hypothetical protein
MDILSILKAEHDQIRTELNKLESSDGVKARRTLIESLARDIQVHLTLEKDYLYPEIAGLFPGAETLVDIGQANGSAISRRLKLLVKMAAKPLAEQAGYDKKEAELKDSLLRHFDFEEQNLMPKVRGLIRTEEREDIGQLFLDVRDEVRKGVEAQAPKAAAPKTVSVVGRKRA